MGRKKKRVAWGIYHPVDIVFTVLDIPLLRQKYRPGQRLVIRKMMHIKGDQGAAAVPIRKQYTVADVYEHHLSCVDKRGMRESFNYIELEQCVVGGRGRWTRKS